MSKAKSTTDKVAGKVKEATGKITDDKELELKGKLQHEKGKLEDKKDKVTTKINNKIDKTKRDMKK